MGAWKKEKGVKDNNIDIIAMNKTEILFIQCNFYLKSKVDHNMLKATRSDVRSYMIEKKELTNLVKDRKKKIIYVVPKENSLTAGAKKYISENNHIIEYETIPMYL